MFVMFFKFADFTIFLEFPMALRPPSEEPSKESSDEMLDEMNKRPEKSFKSRVENETLKDGAVVGTAGAVGAAIFASGAVALAKYLKKKQQRS